jgi:hypothetical protein
MPLLYVLLHAAISHAAVFRAVLPIPTAVFTAVSSPPVCLEMRENTLRSSSPLISCAAATGNAGPFNRVLSDCSPSPARGGNVSWLFVWLLYGHVIRLCNTAWKATASQLFCEAWCTSHVLRVSRILQMNMRDDKPSRCWSCKCYKMRDISFISMVRPL